MDEDDFYLYGFDKLTGMDIYNRNVFNLLVDLPKYCKLINCADDMSERRKHLKTVYEIIEKVTSHVEYVHRNKTEVCSDILEFEEKKVDFIHFWSPSSDLHMMYSFNNINIGSCNIHSIVEQSSAIVLNQIENSEILKLN